MGFRDWFRRKPGKVDPLAAFDQRLDALGERAQLLRKSAATLLAVRRDLDRRLAATDASRKELALRHALAKKTGDDLALRVLGEDLEKQERARQELALQREKVAIDAEALTEAVKTNGAEQETLRLERESAKVRLAASGAVAAAQPAMTERLGEQVKLDAARDEVERAHALAEIYREDAAARRRERG